MLKREGQRSQSLRAVAAKPDRRLGVGMALASVAGLEGFKASLSEGFDVGRNLRIERRTVGPFAGNGGLLSDANFPANRYLFLAC